MKLRNILTMLVAVCALAIGCEQTTPDYLAEVQVSQTVINLPADPVADYTVVEVMVNAVADWEIKYYETDSKTGVKEVKSIPSWLSVTPTSGGAGETKVTFEAKQSTVACNNITLELTCAGKTQYMIVQQGQPSVLNTEETAFTPDYVIENYGKDLKDGMEFYVKGVVKSASIDLGYGNAEFYLEESSDEYSFEFYRCFDFGGEKFTDGEKVKIGDTIIGYGSLTSYKQTIEFGEGCRLVKIIRSNLEVCNRNDLNCGKEGGYVDAKLIVKGGDLRMEPQVDWVTIAKTTLVKGVKKNAPDTTVVTFKVDANVGAPRAGEINLGSGSTDTSVTLNQEGAQSDINDLVLNEPCFVIGTVTGICARGFILTDGTASVLYYKSSGFDASSVNIGDKYAIACTKVTAYGGAFQLDAGNVTSLDKLGSEKYTYPTPVEFDQAKVDEFAGLTTNGFAQYIKFTAKATISGNYYNYFISDGQTNGFSLYQGTDEQKEAFEDGKTYEVEGWLVSRSSKKYCNFVYVSSTEK